MKSESFERYDEDIVTPDQGILVELFAKIIDTLSDFIIITEEDGIIKDVNQQTISCFSIEKRELIGKNITTLLLTPISQPLTEGPPLENKLSISSQERVVSITIMQFPPKQRLLVIKDLSSEKKMESILEENNHFTNIGILSKELMHEINNSLAITMAHLFLLKETIPPAHASTIATIEAPLTHIKNIVKNVGQHRKIDSHGETVFNLHETILNVIALIENIYKKINIMIEYLPAVDPFPVRGGANAIQMAILNILLNIRDAIVTQRGSSSMTNIIKIKISQTENGAALIEMASDRGIPSPTDLNRPLSHLFITKKIIERNHGTINITEFSSSKTGKEHLIQILLPLALQQKL